MKNIDIISTVTAYQQADGTLILPAKIAWTRRVNMKRLMEAKAIIDEAMQEIQNKYADDEHSSEKDGQRLVKPQYMAEFSKEQADILLQETDVDIKMIPIEDLGDIALSDKQMDTLAFMIAE